jgi:glycine/D-amino acid oxidase-like deaminating enzyme
LVTLAGHSDRPDLAVVGAGVMGTWIALTAVERGWRVLLLDAFGPGDPRASSGDESRIIRSGHGTERIYPVWSRESRERWIQLGDEMGESIFVESGVAWLAHAEGGFEADSEATLRQLGIPVEHLAPADAAARWPISPGGLAFVLHEPEAGVLRARAGVRAAARRFEQLGGTIERRRVGPPDARDRGLLVDTAGGAIGRFDEVVFAAGPWLPGLFPDVVGPRIRVTRQDVFYLGTPAGDPTFDASLFPAWIDYEDAFYGIPALDGRGAKVAPDDYGEEIDPDALDRIVDPESVGKTRRFLARRLPALAPEPIVETRVCQYESTSDTHFVIDRHPEHDHTWIVGGGSGHGFKHGPRIGRYVVDRLDGVTDAGLDERFSITRERPPSRGMRSAVPAWVDRRE